jgi:hypothetical protein
MGSSPSRITAISRGSIRLCGRAQGSSISPAAGWSDDDLARLTCRNVLRAMADAGLTAAGEARQLASDPA